MGSVVFMSRLLRPTDFGLVAMAWPVIGFAQLFQDLGLSQAVVQKSSITHDEISCLFWINAAVNLAIAAALVLVGPLAGAFYEDGRVGVLTSAMSLTMLVSGFGAQPGAILNRRMAFGALAAIDAAGAVCGLAASIAWALVWPTYWALFAGSLVAGLVPTLGQWLAAGWLPSRPRLADGWRQLVSFGAGLTGFNLANYFARNLDNVLIGRVWGNLALGLYDRAYKLLVFPLQQVNNPLARVMIPTLSRLVAEPDRYRSAYLRTLGQLLLVTLPGVAFMTATADVLIPYLLGEDWRGAVPIFQALGFAGLLQPMNNTAGWLFISQGRGRDFMWWGIFGAITSIAAFAIGLSYGPFGVAAAYATSEFLRTPFLWLLVARHGPVVTTYVVRRALPHLVGVVASLLGGWADHAVLPVSPILGLTLGCVQSYLLSFACMALFRQGRMTIAETVSIVDGVWDRVRTASFKSMGP
jgi:PST family polysaccharide transporter